KFLALLLAISFTGCKNESAESTSENEYSEEIITKKADSLAQAFIITDGHIHLPYRLKSEGIDVMNRVNGSSLIDAHIGDFVWKRAKESCLDAPVMSVYIPSELQERGRAKSLADSLIDLDESIATTYPDKFSLAGSPEEVECNF